MNRAAALALVFLSALALPHCGSNYRPPLFETTGTPAAPLGLVLDLDVDLENLRIPGAKLPGVRFGMILELEHGGPGEVPARYTIDGRATWFMGTADVEDLSDGETTLTIGPDRWVSGRIGPLRIGNATFELAVDGEPVEGGWRLEGRAWESQSGLPGTFLGWRRQRFLVASTDFLSARVAEVSWVRQREIRVRDALEFVSSDPVLRRTGRSVYAVNRATFDNVQRLDPRQDFQTSWQLGVGDGSNPHDILEVAADRAYVTRYEPPFNDIAVIEPGENGIRGSIDLGVVAENSDATPRADRMIRVGDEVFVSIQDANRSFDEWSEGKLAVIDTLRDELAGVIPLGGLNPSALQALRGADGRERIYVALAGLFAGNAQQPDPQMSGGVVVVDVLNRVVERMALDAAVAGGNVAGLAMVSDDLGYVLVWDESFSSSVLAFDPQLAVIRRSVLQTADWVPEIEVGGGGVLAVPDRSFASPRLCLYRVPGDVQDDETSIGCAALSLAPFSVQALD